jgi:hypothetical protein
VISDLINIAAGLIVGLGTGFYFERRASTATRKENAELRAELSTVRESVYMMGGERAPAKRAHAAQVDDELMAWVLANQDSEGRVQVARVIGEFVRRGVPSSDVQAALDSMCEAGRLSRSEGWVHQ